MATIPKPGPVMAAIPELHPVMAAIPESRPIMAGLPEPHPIMNLLQSPLQSINLLQNSPNAQSSVLCWRQPLSSACSVSTTVVTYELSVCLDTTMKVIPELCLPCHGQGDCP